MANLVSKNVKFGKMAPQAPKILNAPPSGGGMTPKAGGGMIDQKNLPPKRHFLLDFGGKWAKMPPSSWGGIINLPPCFWEIVENAPPPLGGAFS